MNPEGKTEGPGDSRPHLQSLGDSEGPWDPSNQQVTWGSFGGSGAGESGFNIPILSPHLVSPPAQHSPGLPAAHCRPAAGGRPIGPRQESAGEEAAARLSPHCSPSLHWCLSVRGTGSLYSLSVTLGPRERPLHPKHPFSCPISGSLAGRMQDNSEWVWNILPLAVIIIITIPLFTSLHSFPLSLLLLLGSLPEVLSIHI